MIRFFFVVLISLPFALTAQILPLKGGYGGLLSFGQRSTLSTFNGHENEGSSLGLGGQFRIQLSDRVNTEWFLDYLPSSTSAIKRTDYHIGWSVLFYLREDRSKQVQPYILAGHCFDKTQRYEIGNRANSINRWSSAIQAGMGMHYNLTERLDVSLTGQYMLHLGTDIHSEVHTDNSIHFEKVNGGSLEGHLLWSLSFNFKVADLW